ncbi:sugar transferase [Hyphomicrobium sp.]|uniref:sugar transferase n=1 Tax=Hyphomicrobium sp. TaxID=82 RepID=UPI0025C08418|nr:sugar transferase [Hyphomicrobium sp.]MCC7250773.1 sugar transferase [Hyphomicrobium sp.]
MSDVHKIDSWSTGLALGRSRATFGWGSADPERVIGRKKRRLAVGGTLLLGDAVVGWIALTVADLLTRAFFAETGSMVWAQPRLVLMLAILALLGIYSGSARCPYARFRMRSIGILVFVALHSFVLQQTDDLVAVAFRAACESMLLITGTFYVEYLLRHLLIRDGLWTAPTALIGCGPAAQRLYATLEAQPELGLRPVGFVRTPADAQTASGALPGPVLCAIDDFEGLSRTSEVAILTSGDQVPLVPTLESGPLPVEFILLSDAVNIPTLWLGLRPLGSGLGIELERRALLSQNRLLKRMLDLAIAVPAAILAFPVVAAFALLVSLVDRGSPFYWQQRIGVNGRPFNLPKLRTMYRDAAARLEEHLASSPEAKKEWERYFKLKNDPRILPFIGNFMRRTSLDEVPQLWSIIVGDMSLVGPRPFPQYHISSFDPEFQKTRTLVPAGLTGLWQVTARSNGDLDVQRAQDTFYIRNWSIWLDLYILFQTVPAVIGGNGAR